MKTLKIDEKWSVEYDEAQNDRPVELRRYGKPVPKGMHGWTNEVYDMFYALLAHEREAQSPKLPAMNVEEVKNALKLNQPVVFDKALRDEIAMAALPAIIAKAYSAQALEGFKGTAADWWSVEAYIVADAMLKAREGV